jgi:hypothetical protein
MMRVLIEIALLVLSVDADGKAKLRQWMCPPPERACPEGSVPRCWRCAALVGEGNTCSLDYCEQNAIVCYPGLDCEPPHSDANYGVCVKAARR